MEKCSGCNSELEEHKLKNGKCQACIEKEIAYADNMRLIDIIANAEMRSQESQNGHNKKKVTQYSDPEL